MFPSLTGVIRFLIVAGNDIKIIGKKVSVPYRGYSFFNGGRKNKKYKSLLFPSLTGVIRFLILPSKARMATGLKIRFAGQNYF